ncbi:MAG TPA: DUF2079 domain-containing protein [Thermoanaerobaculia bacterium]
MRRVQESLKLEGPLKHHVVAVTLAVFSTAILAWFAIASHHALTTQMNDLGNAVQAIWSGTQGDLMLSVSNDVDSRIKSRLAVHTNVLYYAIVPLYALYPHPELLMVLASIGVGLAGLGIYAYARLGGNDRAWTLLLPLAFFVHPMVHDANVYDFKIITLATAALVWSLWAFDSGRNVLGCALAAIVILSQEDHVLLVIGLGIYLMLTQRKRLGALVAGAAGLYLILMLGVIVPSFYGEGLSRIAGPRNRHSWIRDSNIFSLLGHLLRPDRLRLPAYLLLSTGGLALGAPRLLVVVAPLVIGGMLSKTAWMSQVTGTYYYLPAVAIVLMAASRARKRGAVIAFAASLVCSFLLSPLPHSVVSTWSNYPDPAQSRALLEQTAQVLPPDARMSVQNSLGPWLAHRYDIAAFPQRSETAQFVMFRMRCDFGPSSGLFVRTSPYTMFTFRPEQLADVVRDTIRAPEWSTIAYADGTYLFARDTRGGMPRELALRYHRRDRERFLRECADSFAGRVAARRWLVERFTWSDLM